MQYSVPHQRYDQQVVIGRHLLVSFVSDKIMNFIFKQNKIENKKQNINDQTWNAHWQAHSKHSVTTSFWNAKNTIIAHKIVCEVYY